MKGLFQRGDVWWIRFTPAPGAAQKRRSLGTSDEAEAIIEARKLIASTSAEARRLAGSCEAEIEAYIKTKRRDGLSASTLQSREYVLKAFCTDTGALSPRTISRQALQRWFDARRDKNEHTAADYLQTVQLWFKWLAEEGRIATNYAALIKPPKLPMRVRRTFLLPEQARELIEACDDDGLRFALYCGLHAGMRKLEIIEARRSWFDLDAGLIHIQATATFAPKDRDNRTVPLTDEFRRWIIDWLAREPMKREASSYMLAPAVEKGSYRYRFDFRTAFENLVAAQKLAITFHDLRRTFASLLVSKGISLYKVAKWLGDTIEVVENTYGHLIPQDAEINAAWQ